MCWGSYICEDELACLSVRQGVTYLNARIVLYVFHRQFSTVTESFYFDDSLNVFCQTGFQKEYNNSYHLHIAVTSGIVVGIRDKHELTPEGIQREGP